MANSCARHLFDEVYIQPAAGDDGVALGAALYRTALAEKIPNERFPVPLFGPQYSDAEVETALQCFNGKIQWQRYASVEETCAAAAKLIADGRVIAWYRGRMEYGPRALGNRSILADPGHPEMRDRINAMVKNARSLPAVCAGVFDRGRRTRWFEVAPGAEFPYMISVVNVRPELRTSCPPLRT
jgi:carbamoyltransferase